MKFRRRRRRVRATQGLGDCCRLSNIQIYVLIEQEEAKLRKQHRMFNSELRRLTAKLNHDYNK
jgi:hypothetical protein